MEDKPMTKLLLIEDEAILRGEVAEWLTFEGYDVISAEDGVMGVEYAIRDLPDLIISDITMPRLDGFGVLLNLRSHRETAMIPLIFLTALADKSAMREGMGLGADDYLTKPFTLKELLDAVATRLERQAAINKHIENKLDDFGDGLIYMLPHELRTPLGVIMGYADMILTSGSNQEMSDVLDMVGHVSTAGQRLYHLIENFLLRAQIDLMKPVAERLELIRHMFTAQPSEVIAAQARQEAEQYKRLQDLTLDLGDVAAVRISEGSLKKIVEELVDNAFKFSSAGTPVRVSATMSADEYVLCIGDMGRGMTPTQIAEIGAYVQFERSLYEQQGVGLGLSLTKGLAELHGGTLKLESTLNKGTVVCVTLGMWSSQNEPK
jgi:two-component system, sensor histidine kinase and response regulator